MAPGTVIRSFASTLSFPQDLAFDGMRLWLASPSPSNIYQYDRVSGAIIQSHAIPGFVTGVAWDGKSLWTVSEFDPSVRQIDPDTGTIVRNFTPLVATRSICWTGTHFWIIDDASPENFYIFFPETGTLKFMFTSATDGILAIGFDGKYLWAVNANLSILYQLTVPAGIVVRAVALTLPAPSGIAFDGQCLWMSDTSTDLIYQVSMV